MLCFIYVHDLSWDTLQRNQSLLEAAFIHSSAWRRRGRLMLRHDLSPPQQRAVRLGLPQGLFILEEEKII